MKIDHSLLARTLPTLCFAVVAALVLGAAGVLADRIAPANVWLVASVLIAAAGVVAVGVASRLRRQPEGLAGAIREIARGEAGRTTAARFDQDLRAALDELSARTADLRRDRSRYQMLLENMISGAIAVDCDRRITLFNRAAESMFRIEGSRVVGRTLEDADLHPEVSRMAAECIAGKSVRMCEIRLAGLPERVIGIRASPFVDASGGDCAMILLQDMSEIRRHEKNQKEFVSNVSHELKTPITSVRVTAEALLSGAKNDENLVDRFLNTILAESDRLSALIEDLLDIARRDSGIIVTEKTDVDVRGLIDGVVRVVEPQALQSDVTISVDVADGLRGYCDENQTIQLVRNLVDNAVKYTPAGGAVDVIARQSGDSLVISIRDTGIGIPRGEVHNIFERFYRVDKARSRRLGGTGLGLAIVKDIVESHGGDIAVETQLGKGSAFTVTLPGRSPSAGEDSEQHNG